MGGAKNCPETPRQKMIGMMYLVLTAMLALNVSAEILTGFTKLRHSMEETMKSTDARTAEFMQEFKAAYDETPAKYEDWWAIAQAVREKSNEFYDYIDHFKLDIVNMIDGTNWSSMEECEASEKGFQGNGDTNKPQQYAEQMSADGSGKSNEDRFKEKMDEFRTYITEAESECLVNRINGDPKFKHEWELKQDMMNNMFSTDDVMNEEHEMISFQRSTFHEMPAGATLALLAKYQSDIRVVENDLINFMYAAAGKSKVSVNQISALVMPVNGEYVMQGQRYRARIVSAMIDTNDVPKVFINGQQIDEDGYYDVAATSVGQQTYHGYMLVTGDTTKYDFTGHYTVGAPSATVSHTELNVMYRGYSNVFSVSVPGVGDDKVKVTCAAATPQKTRDGWVINPPLKSPDETFIEVFAEIDGKMMSMAKIKYRLKNLQTPDAYFQVDDNTMLDGETPVSAAQMTKSTGRVVASYGADAVIQAKFKVTGFTVRLASGKMISVKGDKLDAAAIKDIKSLKSKSMFKIQDIQAVSSEGEQKRLRSLSFTLK